MNERGLRVRFIQWSEPATSAQQDRLRKCSLTFVALRTALTRTMQHEDNTMTSTGPKAQGKSIMRLGLIGSLLRKSLTE